MLNEETNVYKYSKESNTTPHCLGFGFMKPPIATCERCGFAFDCEIIYKSNIKRGKINERV
jgi:hypothetical protein